MKKVRKTIGYTLASIPVFALIIGMYLKIGLQGMFWIFIIAIAMTLFIALVAFLLRD